MRDIQKTAQKGEEIIQKRQGLDLRYSELTQFFDSFDERAKATDIYNALWETIATAYKVGLVVGLRNA